MVLFIPARRETIDSFRKQFYKNRYGVGIRYTYEEFIEEKAEEMEEGYIMDEDHTVAVLTDPKTQYIEQFMTKFEVNETLPMPVEWDKLLFTEFASHVKVNSEGMRIGPCMYDPDKLLTLLNILGWNGKPTCFYYATNDHPLVIYNNDLEAVMLAPVTDVKGIDYTEWILAQGEEVSRLLESYKNPDIVRMKIESQGIVDIHRDDIEKITIKHGWQGKYYLVHFVEEAKCRLSGSYTLSEDELNTLMKAFELEAVDERKIVNFNEDELVEQVTEAWKKRDPLFSESVLYQQCIDTVFEMAKYGNRVPASMDFFVKMFPRQPPENLPRFYHSLHTPGEWARTIFNLIGIKGIFSIEYGARWTERSWNDLNIGEEVESDDPRGSFRVYYKLSECDPALRDLPDSFSVEPTNYKAKHLIHYVSNVDVGQGGGWSGWKERQQVAEFEGEEVRA